MDAAADGGGVPPSTPPQEQQQHPLEQSTAELANLHVAHFDELLSQDAAVPENSPFGEALNAEEEIVDRAGGVDKARFGPTHYIHRAKQGEITREHEQYLLTYAMSVGIRHSVTVWQSGDPSGGVRDPRASRHKTLQDVGVHEMKEGVSPEHFGRTYKSFFPPVGGKPGRDPLKVTPPHKLKSGFKFKDYAPEVFGRLRKRFGINDVDYLVSLCGTFNFLEFVSNSKSGEFFFYSHGPLPLHQTRTALQCAHSVKLTTHHHPNNHRRPLPHQDAAQERVQVHAGRAAQVL